MKVYFTFIQHDLLANETKIVAEGIGLLNGDFLIYQEEETKAKHRITFNSEGVVLERKSEVSSRTTLPSNKEGECVVDSPYGKMQFVARLHSSKKIDSHWKVHYSIYSEKEKITEMELEWKFEKLS